MSKKISRTKVIPIIAILCLCLYFGGIKAYMAYPAKGYVPDEITAIRIAEAVWLPIYGDAIYKNRPFFARLVDDKVWIVEGTLESGMLGGVPYAEIQKKDGKILIVTHSQ